MYVFYHLLQLVLLLQYVRAAGKEVEQVYINEFEEQGEIYTMADLAKTIGPFIDPPHIKHQNYDEISLYLKELCANYSELTHLYSIGKSVEGRELWVIVISKFPKQHQTGVPEFKYIANMHGDEVTGRALLVALARTLLENYRTNKYIQRLVDTTRIHLMPSMNPDGYEIAAGRKSVGGQTGRHNANNMDLNRNFPSRFPNFFPSSRIQPETAAVMNWTKSIPFILGANLHGGTTIVNYPFDDYQTRRKYHVYSPSYDNALYIRIAYAYARAHARMWKPGPRCLDDEYVSYLDPEFGITNGAQWYIVSGGLQDWSYLNSNSFEITIELNCVKFPPESELRFFWNENKFALMHFIDEIHNAIHGRITDAITGDGIVNATISIDNYSKIVISYGDGEFWRPINLGTYEVTIDHPLYTPVTRRITVTKERRSPDVSVSLVPLKMPTITSTTTAEPISSDVDSPHRLPVDERRDENWSMEKKYDEISKEFVSVAISKFCSSLFFVLFFSYL